MHELQTVLGLQNANSKWYLFWSGIGGYAIVAITGIIGFVKAHRQRERHTLALKRHLDYRLSKITEEASE